jgi:hypothetical protein
LEMNDEIMRRFTDSRFLWNIYSLFAKITHVVAYHLA